jgi:hypothetical protein
MWLIQDHIKDSDDSRECCRRSRAEAGVQGQQNSNCSNQYILFGEWSAQSFAKPSVYGRFRYLAEAESVIC